MAVRFNEDTGQYIMTSEDEPPVVVYPDPSGEGWINQAQQDQILADQAAAAQAAAAAEVARMAPINALYQKPTVSYAGSPISTTTGGYNLPVGAFIDENGSVRIQNDDGGIGYLRDSEGNTITASAFGTEPGQISFATYQDAVNNYSSGYVPWDALNVYLGLSDRNPFNLNALWGGTQYASGRVTDWSGIDPTQYEANLIASNTRNELWNQYDQLVAQGNTPAKNPDQVALDFYVQTVGPQGNQYGYGPGANTILVTEAIKNKFLNQPEVVRATGQQYVTPEAQLAAAREFGAAHEAGVPVWQVFEQQGYSRDLLGSLMPMILGAMIFPGLGTALSGALGGGVAGQIAAASIIGGVNAELQGGNFIDGAVKAALTAGAGAAIANVGIAAEVSSALKSLDFAPDVADLVAKTAERAVTSAVVAEATGGNAADAVANVLLSAGVSVARSELGDIVSNVTAGETAADIEDADLGAAMTAAQEAAAPQEISNVASQQPEVAAPVAEAPITPAEIISEIQPETVAPVPVEEAVVPRETTEVPPEVAAEAQPEPVTPAPEAAVETAPAEIAPVTPEEILQEIAPEQPVVQEPTPETAPIEPAAPTEPVVEPVVEPAPEQPVEQAPVAVEPEVVTQPEAPTGEVTPEEIFAEITKEIPVALPAEEPVVMPEVIPEVAPEVPSEVVPEPVPEATPAEPAPVEVAPEVAPVEEAPVSDQDLLQALVEEGLLPAEVVTPEPAAPEIAPEVPVEEPPVAEMPAEEVVVEPVVEEAPIFEEPLPEEQPIPEALPEVEPEPVLPEPAPEEPAPAEEPLPAEEAPIGDQDVMQAIADEAQAPEEEVMPEEEPAPAEPEPEAPAVEEPPTEEPATEIPAETPATTAGPSEIDRLIAQLLLGERGGRAAPQRRSTTQESVSPREISGSVTGIIGKKQPMFGGDEDMQTAEWNRRSLRLRKILGL